MTNEELVMEFYNTAKEYHAKVAAGTKRRDLNDYRVKMTEIRGNICKKILRGYSDNCVFLDLAEIKDGNEKLIPVIVGYMDDFDKKKAEGFFNTITWEGQYPYNTIGFLED